MATHEREITEPVELCGPDGRTLAPEARGWSRHPLHTCNLAGRWGRTKRWDYWAILAGDLVVSCVYADVDYLGLADVWWVDLSTKGSGGRAISSPLARGFALPDLPGTAPLRAKRSKLDLAIEDDAEGTTRIDATWIEADGRDGRLTAEIALPPAHESLNVVIPWSDTTFQFTSKHQARPAHGELIVGEDRRRFGASEEGSGLGAEAWGVLDVGRGRWPYSTRWNWGGGAGRAPDGGRVIGLQLGGKWTVGTGATENGVLVDGRLTKIGVELEWTYDWDRPLAPWRVTSPDGAVDLTLTPRYDKHTKVDALVLRTETHQVFGTWAGTVTPDEGEPVAFTDLHGFAEESRSRW